MRIQSTVLLGAVLATTAVLGQGLTDGVSSVTTAPGDSTAEGALPTLATTSAEGAPEVAETDTSNTAVESADPASASASATSGGSGSAIPLPSASGVTGVGGNSTSSNTTAGGNSFQNGTGGGNSTGAASKIIPLVTGLQVLYGPAAALVGAIGLGLATFA